jgi:hippurate hydrolase
VGFSPYPGSSKERLDLTTNHSPTFLPPLQPCLRTGTEAMTTAALAWLALE